MNKQRTIFSFMLISLLMLISIGFSQTTSCPYGEVNEPFPGTCTLYIDQDSNKICDLSEEQTITIDETHDLITGQELKTKTVEEVANIYGINSHTYAHALRDQFGINNIEPQTSFQLLHDNYGVEPSIAKDVANALKTGTTITQTAVEETQINITPKYEFILLTLLIFLMYAFTFTLSKAKQIKYINHLSFWNIMLLLSFLIAGITGILLVIRINYGIAFDMPFNILYWHVELGIVMAVLSILHVLKHLRYFKVMF
jgi:hypothetical protein